MPKPIAIASLSVALTPGDNSLQLMPAGLFRSNDGRPTTCDGWYIDDEIAARLIEVADERKTPYVIDYEHQSMHAATSGNPAPAAGWFKKLEWREGQGLYAVDVRWTKRARDFIAAEEYAFISPMFAFHKERGTVEVLLNAALTNNPALDGMDDVSLAAATRIVAALTAPAGALPAELPIEDPMNIEELLEQLRWLLNMPVGATAEDVKAQLQKLIDQLTGGQGTAAASIDLAALLTEKDTQIAALTSNQLDKAKWVPIEAVQELRNQVASLTQRVASSETDTLVSAALSDGRITPAMEGWARDLAKTNPDALRDFVGKASPIAALSSTQSSVKKPDPQPDGSQLTSEELAVCSAMGLDPATFKS